MADKTQAEAAREQATAAMRQASGKPDDYHKQLKADLDRHPIGPGNGNMAAAELPRKSAANYSLVDRINEMATRDAEDWRYLSETLRKFCAQRRADLDYLERLLGTGK